MTETQTTWYLVTQALIAVGTVGAVIAALFGEAIRRNFFPPDFDFSILKPAGELCPITEVRTGERVAEGRYYHLTVRNTRVWAQATHSQLRLVRIEQRGPDGVLQITWDGDIPIRRAHQEFYSTEAVIGSAVNYDLCAIVNNQEPMLVLEPIIAANNLPVHWKQDAHFVASFQLKCAERDSKVVRVQFDWDGSWQEGEAEAQKHFRLKLC